MIKKISLQEAVGHRLAHDITEIRPGEFKGPAFRRGQQVRQQDLDHLRRLGKSLGKSHLYVIEVGPEEMHEDEAAVALAEALCGPGVSPGGAPSEGKIALLAQKDGLLQIDTEALLRFNLLGEVMCASRHRNVFVRRGETLAATRAIPLVVSRRLVEQAVAIAKNAGGIFSVRELERRRAGLVVTGTEIYQKLVPDSAEPVLRRKLENWGGTLLACRICPDRPELIRDALLELRAAGAELLVACGGMSVDPDDVTRTAILMTGAREAAYGSAALPGAMLMLAYLGDLPLLGTPACIVYSSTTVLDLVLPRLMAGQKLGRLQIAELGHGGMCLQCKECRFPACAFGKGS